jgi:hypothetical protein
MLAGGLAESVRQVGVVYFIICIVAFCIMTSDPFFLVLMAIVGLGFAATLGSYWVDQKTSQGGSVSSLPPSLVQT